MSGGPPTGSWAWTNPSPTFANNTLAQSPSGAVSLTASRLPSPSRSAVVIVRALTTAGESAGHWPTFAVAVLSFAALPALFPASGEPQEARQRTANRSTEVRTRMRIMTVGRSRERTGSGMASR